MLSPPFKLQLHGTARLQPSLLSVILLSRLFLRRPTPPPKLPCVATILHYSTYASSHPQPRQHPRGDLQRTRHRGTVVEVEVGAVKERIAHRVVLHGRHVSFTDRPIAEGTRVTDVAAGYQLHDWRCGFPQRRGKRHHQNQRWPAVCVTHTGGGGLYLRTTQSTVTFAGTLTA